MSYFFSPSEFESFISQMKRGPGKKKGPVLHDTGTFVIYTSSATFNSSCLAHWKCKGSLFPIDPNFCPQKWPFVSTSTPRRWRGKLDTFRNATNWHTDVRVLKSSFQLSTPDVIVLPHSNGASRSCDPTAQRGGWTFICGC